MFKKISCDSKEAALVPKKNIKDYKSTFDICVVS